MLLRYILFFSLLLLTTLGISPSAGFSGFMPTAPNIGYGGAGKTIASAAAKGVAKLGTKAVKKVKNVIPKGKVAKEGGDFFKGTKFTDKVKKQMQWDDFHSFPRSVEGFQDAGKVTKFKGGDGVTREKLEIPGIFKGKEGKFEFIKEPDGTINHRFFRPDGQ